MKTRAVWLALAVLLLCMPIASAQPTGGIGINLGVGVGVGVGVGGGAVAQGGPLVQTMAAQPNAYHLVRQTQNLQRKFPAFLGAYRNNYAHTQAYDTYQVDEGSQKSEVGLLDGDQYKQKAAGGTNPTRVEARGFILPNGYYEWDMGTPWGRAGRTLNPTLTMPGDTAPMNVKDKGYIGPQMSMLDLVDTTHNKRTTSITNAEFALIELGRSELLNELRAEPDRWRQAMQAGQEEKMASQSNQTAEGAEHNTDCGWENVALPLLNVANEEAWVACAPEAPWKSYANGAWMVGQMYKQVYIPMAILLLLPGTLLTQLRVLVKTGFDPDLRGFDDDMYSPFTGIMRAMIAVFLIPATQLFVSYTIDVGNSLTYEVINSPEWNLQMLRDWRNQQTYNVPFANTLNHIENTPEQNMEGKSRDYLEQQTHLERQNFLSSTNQFWFNMLSALLGQGMVALNAFQLIMIMYLFLLGPVAASLYAWPGIGQDIFRAVYANWMDGVVLVTLWKFWWAVIMLAMMVRLSIDPNKVWNDQFEMYMCAAFCAILMYVPFNPFDFRPGDTIASCLDKAEQQMPKGGTGGHVSESSSAAGGSNGGTGGSTGAATGHGQ